MRITKDTISVGEYKKFFELLGNKVYIWNRKIDDSKGSPVFTENGKYTARGWTEWTQGFLYGVPLLYYDAVGDKKSLDYALKNILEKMSVHISHIGVHDHGFNNVSTYGNLRRLIVDKKIKCDEWLLNFSELALRISGAVQASRWSNCKEDYGYIYSFNGPQSLFIDTLRTCRALVVAHKLGHSLMGENDEKINLLDRACIHIKTSAKYNVWYGKNRDFYDVKGRVSHESIFNINDGSYRCASSQQGYSAQSTWTRGLAWAILGFAEQLEVLSEIPESQFLSVSKKEILKICKYACESTCNFYIDNTPIDGIPYWDTGAPNLHKLGNYLDDVAKIKNPYEPVDSSAAAIAAQGFYRFGKFTKNKKFIDCAYTIAKRLFSDDYLSTEKDHQGILLHSIYHRPNGWDYVRDKNLAPYGESSMWGDYHMVELALLLYKELRGEKYYKFV